MHTAPKLDMASSPPPFRRKVFYIPGFDPQATRRYRELYRNEGTAQAAIGNYTLEIEGLPPNENGNYSWNVHWHQDDRTAQTTIECLGWNDIVRKNAQLSLFELYCILIRTFWIYLSTGALRAMFKLGRGPLIAGLVPASMMVFYLVYALLAGGAVARLLAGPAGLPWVLAGLAGIGTAMLAMRATRLFDEQTMIYFMIGDLGYWARERGAYPETLSQRLDLFATQIKDALADPAYDEVLVVGHSSGSQLAVSALARVLRDPPAQENGHLALLSLGQSIAMMSFLPQAHELRADLAQLQDSYRLFWLDVSAPGDGACFALSDPAATCRQGGRPANAPNPLVISASFRQNMDPQTLRRLRWRLLRLHFQYLCAFANPHNYDYFQITAGPYPLALRCASRGHSPSMRTTPLAPVLHPG